MSLFPALGLSVVALVLCWVAYLLVAIWLVCRTGDTRCLRDLAVAARAFPLFPRWRRRSRKPPDDP